MARITLRPRGRFADNGAPRKGDEKELLRWCRQVVADVGAREAEMRERADDEFPKLTRSYQARLTAGETLDSLLPEAFAAVREAAARTLGQRPYDVQVMGGAVVHLGRIAEMLTGEGKTLAIILPAYLNALPGLGVHLLTANDYLAERDAEWMGPVYRFLGLNVGLLDAAQTPDVAVRRQAYAADVTYGGYKQFAYDYLRDNMTWDAAEVVQRGQNMAIVDEADLVLIDQARATPQITGPGSDSASDPAGVEARSPAELAEVVARLRPGLHYDTVPSRRSVVLTDDGIRQIEEWLGIDSLYDEPNQPLIHRVRSALEAKELYQKDQDYFVEDGLVVIIDEVSGRPQHGLRYMDGLHEAIEAKEGLAIRPSAQILALIAVWDYIRQYRYLAGMTGTAMTDREIYQRIYSLDVVTIPTNRPMIRVDHPDRIYSMQAGKLEAITDEIANRNATGQPVLIGAGSVQQAEAISGLLSARSIDHEVLTAKNHEREAEVIARAARLGAVTVIAKMAGRGVDIVLGGGDPAERDAVADLGGLYVLGAERGSAGRIDMHLRGRAGRQGDPGESRFFVSFDDEQFKNMDPTALAIVRRSFKDTGAESARVSGALDKIQASMAGKTAARLNRQLEYDAVLADQRHLVYAERRAAFNPEELCERIQDMLDGPDDRQAYARREAELTSAVMRELEKRVTLVVIDRSWRGHLEEMSDLLRVIQARSASGVAPLADYRREATVLLDALRARIREEIVRLLLTVEIKPVDDPQ